MSYRLPALFLSLVPLWGTVVACHHGTPADENAGDAFQRSGTHGEQFFDGARLREAFERDGVYWVSPAMHQNGAVGSVAAMLDARHVDDSILFEARGMYPETEWVPLSAVWREDVSWVVRARLPRISGAAQIRIAEHDVDEVLFIAWSASALPPGSAAATEPRARDDEHGSSTSVLIEPSVGVVRSALDATLENIGVQSRAVWGARETGCGSQDIAKYRATMHHSATPPKADGTYAGRIRHIQSFHIDGNGWCDLGYHFLVTADGTMWEGRPAELVGAHVSSSNAGNLGLCLVGCFDSAACDAATHGPAVLSDAAEVAAGALLKALAALHEFPVTEATVIGHQEYPGAATACPGDDVLGRLSTIRDLATWVEPGDDDGVIEGVVWDLTVTDNPTELDNVRLADAMVRIFTGDGLEAVGSPVAVRSPDAWWSLAAPPGLYSISVTAPGYLAGTRAVQVVAGETTWASIGLAPADNLEDRVLLSVVVHDGAFASDALLPGARVLTAGQTGVADAQGMASFWVPLGPRVIAVDHPGYHTTWIARTYESAVAATVDVRLHPQDPIDLEPHAPAEPELTFTEPPAGDGCTQARPHGAVWLCVGALLFGRRRSPRSCALLGL